MQVELSTDHNIEGDERLAARVEEIVSRALAQRQDRVTRVEVHLSDQISKNAKRHGETSCTMEARIEGLKPVAVNETGANVDMAIKGAARKLASSIETILGRLNDAK